MNYQDYVTLKNGIVPRLRFNQSIYEDAVAEHVGPETVWLEAGCGKRILSPWREEAERTLVRGAKLVVGCDVGVASIRKHRTLDRVAVADLEHLPFRTRSIDVITCNMVVEHLDRPGVVFAEFARVLKAGGRIILHTPNATSHFVLGSRLVPRRLKLKLVRALDGRLPDDVFPTKYRANTPRILRTLMSRAGLREERLRLLANEATLAVTHPVLAVMELLYIRLTLMPAFRFLRVSILAVFRKPPPEPW